MFWSWLEGCLGAGCKEAVPLSAKMSRENSMSRVIGSDFLFYVLEFQGKLPVYSLILRFVSTKENTVCRENFQGFIKEEKKIVRTTMVPGTQYLINT